MGRIKLLVIFWVYVVMCIRLVVVIFRFKVFVVVVFGSYGGFYEFEKFFKLCFNCVVVLVYIWVFFLREVVSF